MVQAGDKVVWASDAFAEAHGRAEEALTELLEERGRCLREAASSVRKHGEHSHDSLAPVLPRN